MSRWFVKTPKVRVEAWGPTSLLIRRLSSANVAIDLALSRTLGFLHVGEAFSFVHEGWWLMGTSTGAVVVSDQCPYADLLLRDAELNGVAEQIPDKFVFHHMSRPWRLPGSANADGVALLTFRDLQSMRGRGLQTRVKSIRDFPRVL